MKGNPKPVKIQGPFAPISISHPGAGRKRERSAHAKQKI